MAKLICLQAGHYPRKVGATGAPGEQENNWRIVNRLDDLLIERGFVIQIVGADPTDAEINKDFDLFLSLHCDANTAGEGGCIGFPEPSTDEATYESQRIAKEIENLYFPESGIKDVPNKVTNNIRYYYMWKRLSAKTPCVLLEMGESLDAHDQVILNDTEIVAKAIAKGICKAFGVSYEPTPSPTPTPTPTPDPCEAKNKEIEVLKSMVASQKSDFEAKLALKDEECEEKIESYKSRLAVELEKTIKNTK